MIADTTARHRYNYAYDALGRLTAASYSSVRHESWSGNLIESGKPDWSTSYGYDLNGNITSIRRNGVNHAIAVFDNTAWGFGKIDDVSLTYDGNRLVKADDKCAELTYAGAMDFKDGANEAEEYTYDDNGNMTSDMNRGIKRITYNRRNLPSRIDFADGHITRYTYAADGRKLRAQYLINAIAAVTDPVEPAEPMEPMSASLISDEPTVVIDTAVHSAISQEQVLTTIDYCGNHIYRNGRLEQVLNDYGYADSTGTLCFYIKDYQGNVCAVIDNAGNLLETSSYYPYGMLMAGGEATIQPRKYGTKELDRQHGLDLYDSQARWYDPTTARTTTQDPLAEKYYPTSPYLWCGANPAFFTDPIGLYFDSIGDKQAHTYRDKLEKRKCELAEIKGKQQLEMLNEVILSLKDIEDMQNDPNIKYEFEVGTSNDAPCINQIYEGSVLLRIDGSTNGSFAHEIKHGGQIARNEFKFDEKNNPVGYGASHELQAYRAQLAYAGYIEYMPYYDFEHDIKAVLQATYGGQKMLWEKITKLSKITRKWLGKMYEGAGINIYKLYDFDRSWYNR